MRFRTTIVIGLLLSTIGACSIDDTRDQSARAARDLSWSQSTDVEQLWQQYTAGRGGLTWGRSSTFPEYSKVKEGDTLLVELQQGPCLMEFFHGRWRRANDVRRWDDSVNDYGGCPHVFE